VVSKVRLQDEPNQMFALKEIEFTNQYDKEKVMKEAKLIIQFRNSKHIVRLEDYWKKAQPRSVSAYGEKVRESVLAPSGDFYL